jgi:hypothetical protein
MPSLNQLEELTQLSRSYLDGLAARIQALPPGDPHLASLKQIHEHLTSLFGKLPDVVKEHNAQIKKTVDDATASINANRAKLAEIIKNRPQPRPRIPRPKVVADPLLEEKLQLALHSRFGNRTPHTR